MVLIYHDIYRRKCRILGRFRVSCTNLDGHLNCKNFKTYDLVLSESFHTLRDRNNQNTATYHCRDVTSKLLQLQENCVENNKHT